MSMFLKSVRIQHYKSLDDVEIADLQPLTLLVGANGTGKSNVVDALKFLRDVAADGLDHAMSKRGGIGIVRQYSPRGAFRISIAVEFIEHDHFNYRYEITISSQKGGSFQIEQELLNGWREDVIHTDEDGWEEVLLPSKLRRDTTGTIFVDGVDYELFLAADVAALGLGKLDIFKPVNYFFSHFSFSTIYPNTLREPSRPDTDRALKESGQNWASILKAMRKTGAGKQSLERIKEMMRVVMPSLEDVMVKTVGGYLVPQFRVRDGAEANAHDFDPVQLSDGTLRIFGILLALYQNPPPPFIALEEPEQTVHPAILATLAEAFREVSEHTQILVTSHSPHFVDYFHPEEIRVVCMENGATRVSPIRRAQLEAVKERLISLEEIMASEGLQPELP
ncbi:MAG: AAA family ATPase [Sulfuricella sp.]|nr:AAA family ATPase [Sulfuricella sp.]